MISLDTTLAIISSEIRRADFWVLSLSSFEELIFPTDFDNDWYDYQATVMLPVGSAPGQWGVTELTLRESSKF